MPGAIRRLRPDHVFCGEGRQYVFFPPAGGTAGMFERLAAAAPRTRCSAVEYPGRGDRIEAPLPGALDELAEQTAGGLRDVFGDDGLRRTVLVGFSMGAFVALEAALRVVSAALVVVGVTAPQRRRPKPYELSEADLMDLLRLDGGSLSQSAADDPDVRAYLLDLLGADMRLMASYGGPTTFRRLSCPVVALCGAEDRQRVGDDATEAWAVWTNAAFASQVVPGAHLGLLDDPAREFWRQMSLHLADETRTEPENIR